MFMTGWFMGPGAASWFMGPDHRVPRKLQSREEVVTGPTCGGVAKGPG